MKLLVIPNHREAAVLGVCAADMAAWCKMFLCIVNAGRKKSISDYVQREFQTSIQPKLELLKKQAA